jgi:hypothetical protein
MVQAPPRPASQVVELSKPAHFKGTVSPEYSNLKMVQAPPLASLPGSRVI